jgi:hypothetical protein
MEGAAGRLNYVTMSFVICMLGLTFVRSVNNKEKREAEHVMNMGEVKIHFGLKISRHRRRW